MARRSIVPATVVPIASEVLSNDTTDQIADNPIHSTTLKEPTNTAPDPDVSILRPETQPVNSGEHATTSVVDGALVEQQPLPARRITSASSDQGTHPSVKSPLALTMTLVRHKKNYTALAIDFKSMEPFSREPNGSYPEDTLCILCASVKPISVFFPCQHMCVCNACIAINDMSPESSLKPEQCVCPVCNADIHIIFLHTGCEEEAYWNWALASKPFLASDFKKSFKITGKMLSENSPTKRRKSSVESRTIHPPAELQHETESFRRKSWTPTTKAVYKVQIPKTPHTCSIL